jgi:hypothetical protein
MLLSAKAVSGGKRGGGGDDLVQRKMAAGVCGSYTSALKCTSAVPLAGMVGEQTSSLGWGCKGAFNGPCGLCSVDCNFGGGRPFLLSVNGIAMSTRGSIDPVPKGQEVWKKEG